MRVHGSLNALLDASLGMNLELTGRENIMLRGLYNGLPRPALPRLEEDVAEFAGLGDFLDLPVRIYSAGMVVRLGFALATAIRPADPADGRMDPGRRRGIHGARTAPAGDDGARRRHPGPIEP